MSIAGSYVVSRDTLYQRNVSFRMYRYRSIYSTLKKKKFLELKEIFPNKVYFSNLQKYLLHLRNLALYL